MKVLARQLWQLFWLMVFSSGVALAEQPGTPRLETWAALPQIQALSLSSEGTYIAGLKLEEGVLRLAVWARTHDLDDAHVIDLDEDRIAWFGWAGDRYLLISASYFVQYETRGFYQRQLFTYDVRRRRLRSVRPPLSPRQRFKGYFRDLLVDLLPEREDHVLVGFDVREPGWPAVYRLNMRTGRTYPVEPHQAPIVRWIADREGRVRLGAGYEGTERMIFYRHPNGPWQEIFRGDSVFGPAFFPVDFVPADADQLLVKSDHEGRVGLYRYRISTGEFEERLFLHPENDLGSVVLDRGGGLPLAYGIHSDQPRKIAAQPWFHQVQKLAARLLPDERTMVFGFSGDRRFVLVGTEAADDPGGYYILDVAQEAVEPLARQHPGLDTVTPARVQTVRYPARDGTMIPAVLTLPPEDFGEGPWPGIVMPHGGPVARTTVSFNPLVQFLAHQGYAVLQPNFRGSEGYGRAFEAAGYNQWGRLMQSDIADGARWLRDSGIAQAGRQCIAGGSFGGYAALLAVIETPDLFRCAAALNPVSDVGMLVENLQLNRFANLAVPRISGGQSENDLKAISPYYRAGEVARPVLILHGDRDASVSAQQSTKMVKRLKELGKPVSFIPLPGSGHSLLRLEERKAYFSALREFFARHLGPATAAGGNTFQPHMPEDQSADTEP